MARAGKALNRWAGIAALAIAAGVPLVAPEAQRRGLPEIWDIAMGAHVDTLPVVEFVDPACGSNGGPPGLFLNGFEDFRRCQPDLETGLREIGFVYDDELEYIARATREPALIERYRATQVLGHPVMLSFLVAEDGAIRGYRIITDSRAETEKRYNAYLLAVHLQSRFGEGEWNCVDLPPADGQTPIGNQFFKQRCEKQVAGLTYRVDSNYFYKPGQAMRNPINNQPMVGEFESSTRLEVVELPEP